MAEERSLYSGGKVGIDIVPDTSRFWSILNAKLRERDPQVAVDVDVQAKSYEAWASRTDGRTLSNTVKVDGDYRALDDLLRRQDQTRQAFKRMGDAMAVQAGRNARDMERSASVSAVSARKNVTDSLEAVDAKSADTYKTLRDMRAEGVKLSAQQAKLDREWADRQADLTKRMLANRRSLGAYTTNLTKARNTLKDLQSKFDSAKQSGDKDTMESTREAINRTRQSISRFRKEISGLDRDWRKMSRELESGAKKHEKAVKPLADGIRKASGSVAELRAGLRKLGGERHVADLSRMFAEPGQWPMLKQGLTDTVKLSKAARQNLETMMRVTERSDMRKPMADAVKAMGDLRETAMDTTGRVGDLDREFSQWVKSVRNARPFGAFSSDLARQVNAIGDKISRLRGMVDKQPAVVKATLDDTQFLNAYNRVLQRIENLDRGIQRERELDVRVKIWDDAADRLEERLDKLRHERVDIPSDIIIDNERIIRRMRDIARNIRLDPSRDWEVEADLDVDVRDAQKRMDEFKDRNDKLSMDVDFESKLASAHLAYLTRPRTVNIIAAVKDTDLGKLLNGMTYGATGLKGVENQFQRLISLFDELDTVVPRLALIGGVMSNIGAGAVNLAGSVSGLTRSMLALSKAAYAAPAALASLGAAGYVGYVVFKDLKEKAADTATALSGLNHQLGEAAWAEYGRKLATVTDSIAPALRRGLAGIATEQGRVLAGLLDILEQSGKTGQLPAILERARTAIANLTPGVEQVAQAFVRLGGTGSQYLPRFTMWLSENAAWFNAWADDISNRGGTVESAMGKVAEQAGYLGGMVGSLKDIILGLLDPLDTYQNGIMNMAEVTARAAKAVQSVPFQDTLNTWVAGARRAQSAFRDSFNQIGDAANTLRGDTATVMADFGRLTGTVVGNVSRLLQGMGRGLTDFSGGVADGFGRMSGALADAAPMFSRFATMAGQLTRAFGGTFASTLKALSPSLTAIAQVTGTLADMFSKIPAPVQAALGIWVTFGRAASTALGTLKTAMLDNVQKTLAYQKTMLQLGVSADKAKVSILQLVSAMAALNRGQVSGALSATVTGIRQLGTQADDTRAKLAAMDGTAESGGQGVLFLSNGARDAGGSLKETGSIALGAASKVEQSGANASKAGSMFSRMAQGAKTAGSTALAAFGFTPQMAAAVAGISVAVTAFSAYQQHVAAAQARQESFNAAVKATPGALRETASNLNGLRTQLDDIGETARKNLDSESFDIFDKMFRSGYGKTFDNVSDAIDAYNRNSGKAQISTVSLAKAVSGSDTEYNKLLATLQKVKREGTTETFGYADTLSEAASAADAITEAVRKQRDASKESVYAQADAVGKTREWVDAQLKAGQTIQGVSQGLIGQTEKTQRLNSVQTALNTILDDSRSKQIQASAAASSYYTTLDNMGESLKRVNDLHRQGQQVWDATAKDFDYTTEAGRTAADALTALASSSNSYLDAMIANGATADAVKAKQAELSRNFNDTAAKAGVAKDQINGLNQSMLMTPRQIETQVSVTVLETKSQLVALIDQIQFLFPDDTREQTRKMLVESVISGKTDAKQLNDIITALTDHKHIVTFDADGTPAIQSVEELERKLVNGFGGSKGDVTILLNAKDDASGKIRNAISLALLFGMTPAEIDLVAHTDNASKKLDDIRAKLQASGLTDKQIDILFDAIDNTRYGVDSANGTISMVPARKDVYIFGQDQTAPAVALSTLRINGVRQANPAYIFGQDQTAPAVQSARSRIASVQGKTVQVNAVTTGLGGVQSLAYSIRMLRDKTITVSTFFRNVNQNISQNFGRQAAGGRVVGPGTATSDSIPTLLSNGEMVIKAASVKRLDARFGRGFLDRLNTTGDIHKALSSKTASPSPTALAYRRANVRMMNAGGRVSGGGWSLTVNPVVKVEANDSKPSGMVTNNITVNGGTVSDSRIARAVETILEAAARGRNMGM